MFGKINDFEELKKEYKRLAKIHHPDMGGNEEEFKKLNAEFERYSKILLNGEGEKNKEDGFKETAETMEVFKDLINELFKYENVEIEICGLWLWIGGETKPIKDILKKHGCYWAKNKNKWYYRPPEFKCHSRKTLTMDEIRKKYGSEEIHKTYKEPKKIAK